MVFPVKKMTQKVTLAKVTAKNDPNPKNSLCPNLARENITIKILLFLFYLIKKNLTSKFCVGCTSNLSKNARTYAYKCWSKPALGLAIEVSLVKAIVKLGT